MTPVTQRTYEEVAMFLSTLVGRSKQEATDMATTNHWITRIMSEDGKSYLCSCDMLTNRINFEISAGVVTKASAG